MYHGLIWHWLRMAGWVAGCALLLACVELGLDFTSTATDIRAQAAIELSLLTHRFEHLAEEGDIRALHDALQETRFPSHLLAVRIHPPGSDVREPMVESEHWAALRAANPPRLVVAEAWESRYVFNDQAPFQLRIQPQGAKQPTMDWIVDGPAIASRINRTLVGNLLLHWFICSATLFLGMMVIHRRLSRPLARLIRLIDADAPPQAIIEESRQHIGYPARVLQTVGGHLARLTDDAAALARSADSSLLLYSQAPAAMITLGPDGVILQSNERAAKLLNIPQGQHLIGRPVLDLLRQEDRGLFRQSIARLESGMIDRTSFQASPQHGAACIEAEFHPARDDQGRLLRVDIALSDVSALHAKLQEAAGRSEMLRRLLDHLPDAVLLVDDQGRIAWLNGKIARMLRVQPGDLAGKPYEPAEFWKPLDIINQSGFDKRLARAGESLTITTEQFDSAAASHLFQVIPVKDEQDQLLWRLWLVQEVSAQARSRRQLEVQAAQLTALRQVGQSLHGALNHEQILDRAVTEIQRIMDIEMVGLALRSRSQFRRCRQIIHPGGPRSPYPSGMRLAEAVGRTLMPRVLSDQATCLWTDLSRESEWAEAFRQSGLEAMAGTPLVNLNRTLGVFWIARKGGRSIERHDLQMIEAIAPVIAASLDRAELQEQLRDLHLTDPLTHLPSHTHFDLMLSHFAGQIAPRWSLVMVDVDDMRRVNADHGVPGGDAALRTLSRILLNACRTSDLVVRYHEDTFAILCENAPKQVAHEMGVRILQALEKTDIETADDRLFRIQCSIGVATCPDDETDPDLMIHLACQRLAIARANGGNCVVSEGVHHLEPVG